MCDKCGKQFTEKSNPTRQMKTHVQSSQTYIYNISGKEFSRPDNKKRHEESHNYTITCPVCGQYSNRRESMLHHRALHERPETKQRPSINQHSSNLLRRRSQRILKDLDPSRLTSSLFVLNIGATRWSGWVVPRTSSISIWYIRMIEGARGPFSEDVWSDNFWIFFWSAFLFIVRSSGGPDWASALCNICCLVVFNLVLAACFRFFLWTASPTMLSPVFRASRSNALAPLFNKGMAALNSPPNILPRPIQKSIQYTASTIRALTKDKKVW